jgi:hypothetical protein
MLDNFENIEEGFNPEEAAFLNDSWAKMSAMLEDEMPDGAAPVKQTAANDGRYLVLLLLLILIGGGLWLGTKESSITSEAAQTNVAWATSNNEHTNVIADVIITKEETAIEVQVLDQASIESMKISTKKKFTEAMTIPQRGPSKSASSNKTKGTKVLLSQSSIATLRTDGPLAASETSTVLKSITSELKVVTIPTVPAEITNTDLRTIDEKLELNTTQEQITGESLKTKSLLIPIKNTKRWTYGLTAGIQQEKMTQGFGGFSIGFLVNRKMARNFTLETGLNYSMTQFNNVMINNSPTAVAFNQPEQNQSSGIEEELTLTYQSSDANQEDAIQFGSASWLSIPLLLTYQPSRSWRVNMGMEYSQLLQAKEQKIINNTSGESGRITNLIGKNNISALTGLTWFPRKNLGIDIRYIFGFTDLSKTSPKFIEQTDTRAALQWN